MSSQVAVVVVLCAAAAAALLVGPAAPRARPVGPRGGLPPVASLLALAVAAVSVVTWLDGTALALALVALGCGACAARLVARGRALGHALERQRRVVEVGETLLGELRAGQPVLAGLDRCAEVWPPVEPVAAAARLGADVPAAWDRLAALPGAEGLRELASAWRVSQRSGAALTTAVSQVAASARARQAAAQLVRAELAGAQATARLVAVLPLATMLMAAGIGAQPWHFLLRTSAGLTCLGLGAALVFTGLWWIDRIAASVARR